MLKLDREQLLRDFRAAWEASEILFSALKTEADFLATPEHGLRHPLIFYYGHAPVFYINKLHLSGLLSGPLNEEFEHLFAIGVDEHSWDDMSKNTSAWPKLAEVKAYRTLVYETIVRLIETRAEFSQVPVRGGAVWALLMGIEHEWIHLETTSVLMRELDLKHLHPPSQFPSVHPSARFFSGLAPKSAAASPRWLEISSGQVQIGRPANWPIFGWDNEFGKKQVNVPAFAARQTLASNAEFFAFVEAGGYKNKQLWSEEGWAWREFRNTSMPRFWVTRDGSFYLRTLFEEIPLPWTWPAVVNFHESKAFADWRSQVEGAPIRLLTEKEHHRLRQSTDSQTYQNWFSRSSPNYAGANFNLRFGSESPCEASGDITQNRIQDLFGNLWQWCEDIFEPLEGFSPDPLYKDYSVPSFDGRHQLLLGGSFMSSGEATSPWTRNNFRRHFFQHAGVRLVRST